MAKRRAKTLEVVKEIAARWGGECTSDEYPAGAKRLQFRCKNGHTWKALPSEIKSGKWCKECPRENVRTKPLNLGTLREIARMRGGICLSRKYVNKDALLRWKCRHGHTWEAGAGSVRRSGTWCPTCARIRGRRQELVETIARSHGGELLSDVLPWKMALVRCRCTEGHEFEVTILDLLRGEWCPECRRHE